MPDRPTGRSWSASDHSYLEPERDSTIEEMVKGRKLRPVKPIARYQQDLVNQAGETIAGAQAAAGASARVAFNAAYDAMRFTVDAHLTAHGLRVESGEGGHAHRVTYAKLAMSEIVTTDDIDFYAAARQVRHRNEYPEPEDYLHVTEANAKAAIEVAKRFHEAVKNHLKPTSRNKAE